MHFDARKNENDVKDRQDGIIVNMSPNAREAGSTGVTYLSPPWGGIAWVMERMGGFPNTSYDGTFYEWFCLYSHNAQAKKNWEPLAKRSTRLFFLIENLHVRRLGHRCGRAAVSGSFYLSELFCPVGMGVGHTIVKQRGVTFTTGVVHNSGSHGGPVPFENHSLSPMGDKSFWVFLTFSL